MDVSSNDGYKELKQKAAAAKIALARLNISRELNKNPDFETRPQLKKFIIATHNPDIAESVHKDKSYWSRLFCKTSTINKGSDLGRVFNANTTKKIIEINNLHTLDVAPKCLIKQKLLFARPSKPYGYHDAWVIVAKKIDGMPWMEGSKISLLEVQHLTEFVQKTGYVDFWGANQNVIRDAKTQKLTFIDTESNSFFDPSPMTQLNVTINLIDNVGYSMEPEAFIWLQNEIERLTIENDQTIIKSMCYQTYKMNPTINFKQIKKEYDHLENE